MISDIFVHGLQTARKTWVGIEGAQQVRQDLGIKTENKFQDSVI